jgi:hypothetical protein
MLMLSIRPENYKGAATLRLHRELYRRFAALPGVESVTTFDDVPLGGANVTTNDLSSTASARGFSRTWASPCSPGERWTSGTRSSGGRWR